MVLVEVSHAPAIAASEIASDSSDRLSGGDGVLAELHGTDGEPRHEGHCRYFAHFCTRQFLISDT